MQEKIDFCRFVCEKRYWITFSVTSRVNVRFFSSLQTGSGKTYTMGTGFEVEVQEHQTGILPRAIKHLFTGMKERIQNARQNGEPSPDFKIDAQFMELYNDDIIDLLDPTQGYLTRVCFVLL